MFEHFRVFFLATFQLNLLMYCLPLSIRFSREPLLLSVILLGLIAVFKSYPGLGDVGFFLALLPIFSKLLPFLKQVSLQI
jgi:GPI-anchor transamidase subunit U